jgi:hypothetical protein
MKGMENLFFLSLVDEKLEEFEKKREQELRTIVVIEILNLTNAERSTNLNYCFVNIPKYEVLQLQKETLKITPLETEVIKKLKMAERRQIYFYTKDGTPIYEYLDIPPQDLVLFVGYQVSFSGIERLYCSGQQKQNLLYAIFEVV